MKKRILTFITALSIACSTLGSGFSAFAAENTQTIAEHPAFSEAENTEKPEKESTDPAEEDESISLRDDSEMDQAGEADQPQKAAATEEPAFPLTENYPEGIDPVDDVLFQDRELYRPLNTGFETLEETNEVAENNKNGQRSIVEDKHNGRFALKLVQKADEILPVKESDSFWITDVPVNVARSLSEDDSYLPEIGQHQYKQNVINIWIKPMYKAQELFFYTKVGKDLVPIQSDKNGDGIFKLGEDFGQGTWQRLSLNLLKTETDITGYASGLYVKANIGSEWIMDDITSEYMDIHENDMDLGEFAANNVVNTENGLQFSQTEDGFNTAGNVITAGVDLSEKIAGVEIDSENRKINDQNEGKDAIEKTVLEVPFESEDWIVNDQNYDTAKENVSRKAGEIREREITPQIPETGKTMMVNIDDDKESRFRLIFTKTYSGTLTFSAGSKIYDFSEYNANKKEFYTEWFDSDLTITTSRSSMASAYFTIIRIEYEAKDELNQDIAMKASGSAALNLANNITTTDRTKLTISAKYNQTAPTNDTEIGISIFNTANVQIYETKAVIDIGNIRDEQRLELILPKLASAARFEIKNLASPASDGSDEVKICAFKITELVDSDWNYLYRNLNKSNTSTYMDKIPSGAKNVTLQNVSELYEEEEYYAISNLKAKGLVSAEEAQGTMSVSAGMVVRYINLNPTAQYMKVGSNTVWLNYGENDVEIKEAGTLTLPAADSKIIILKTTTYASEKDIANENNIPFTYIEGLNETPKISEDGKKIYYHNYFDNRAIYSYDLTTGVYKKLLDSANEFEIAADRYILLTNGSRDYTLYDLQEGTAEDIPATVTINRIYLSPQGDVFVCTTGTTLTLYSYSNGAYAPVCTDSKYMSYAFNTCEMKFSASGEYAVFASKYDQKKQSINILKKTDGVWTTIISPSYPWYEDNDMEIKTNFCLTNDGGKLFYTIENDINEQIHKIDLVSGAHSLLMDGADEIKGTLIQVCDDGRVLYADGEGYIYLLDTVTGEKQKPLNNKLDYMFVRYISYENKIVYMAANYMIGQTIIGDRETAERYLFSFDGGASWYAFRGGRWILSSQSVKPSAEECKLNGMTAAEVNTIKPVQFDEIYRNGSDVVTLNVAVYMNSASTQISPVIHRITVKTMANQTENRLSAARYQKYSKADYTKLHGIFPVESFQKPAEAYYVLSLGNDWLYTFKNGKIVKLTKSADVLFDQDGLAANWIEIKQYGMTAAELRSIPEAALNDLLLNAEYANTEFGVICVIRPAADEVSTSGYKVDYRLQADANYFDYTEMVMEITVNGMNLTLTAPDEISKEAIDDFMSWLSSRQAGKGDIFYRLQTNDRQYFVNYYMISHVNVYDKDAYTAPANTLPMQMNGLHAFGETNPPAADEDQNKAEDAA